MINISRPNTLSDRVVDSISETEREGSLYSTEKLKSQPSYKENSQDVQELLRIITQEIKSLVLSELNNTSRINHRNYGGYGGYNRANPDNKVSALGKIYHRVNSLDRELRMDTQYVSVVINQVMLQGIVDKMPGASTTHGPI
ncbi:hypothetical protein QE152_g38408 [Popillia japonica]|uniref:Uncharacterized protein n=1 Tax=Popillia japonica TaxID=7064 RepID=A0AAW1HWX3_POPJA